MSIGVVVYIKVGIFYCLDLLLNFPHYRHSMNLHYNSYFVFFICPLRRPLQRDLKDNLATRISLSRFPKDLGSNLIIIYANFWPKIICTLDSVFKY